VRYLIEYRVKAAQHGGWIFSKSNLFPTLAIRYRESGTKRWVSLGRAEIDLYTYLRFQNTYYKDFKRGTTAMATLESKSDYERLDLFATILTNEFHDSIKELVQSIVREDIVMDEAELEESEQADRIAMVLVTDGCMATSVQV